jgi:hypothetical protein
VDKSDADSLLREGNWNGIMGKEGLEECILASSLDTLLLQISIMQGLQC